MLTTLGQLEEGDKFVFPALPSVGVCVFDGHSPVSHGCYYIRPDGEIRIATSNSVVDKLE